MLCNLTDMNLRNLQEAQCAHDLEAHQDVVSFSAQRRMTHFALHFSKYVGSFLKAKRIDDRQTLTRLVTDTFIISLSAANSLSIDLRSMQPSAIAVQPRRDAFELILALAEAAGEMAKACEAWDHKEDFPIQDVLEDATSKIAFLSMQMASAESIDLTSAVFDRWEAIERKVRATTLSEAGSKTNQPAHAAA